MQTVSSTPSATTFHQDDPACLPGRPADPHDYPPPPPECSPYQWILLFFLYRLRQAPDPAESVIVNLPDLQAWVPKSKRWIYRGFHTLAAYGLLYSTPIGPDEGIDRRRYRKRFWLRVDAGIDPALSRRLAGKADDDTGGDAAPFPTDAEWVGRIRPIRPVLPPAAPAPDVAPASPAAAAAGPAEDPPAENDPPSADSSPPPPAGGSAGASTVPNGAPDAPAAPSRPSGLRIPALRPPSHDLDPTLLQQALSALSKLFGEPTPRALVRVKVPDDPVITLERAEDYRDREAVRHVWCQHYGPDVEMQPKKDLGDVPATSFKNFILPSDPEFQPGKHGWRYFRGCWHAPETICGCFRSGLRELFEQLMRVPGPDPQPAG